MNVCFVEFGYPTKNFGGGAGTYVQIITKELVKRGHKTFIISKYFSGEQEEYEDEGILIKRIKIRGWHWYFTKIPFIGRILARFFKIVEWSLVVNREIKKLHKKYRLDLVEFPESANFLYFLQLNLPYIVHLHGSSFTFKKYCKEKIKIEDKLQRKIEGFFIKKAKIITSPSYFLKEEVKCEFGIEDREIKVIPYPIDKHFWKETVNIKNNIKIVFYAGRLEKRKGVHILKESIPLVIKNYSNVKFLLFGQESKEITKENLMNYFVQQKVADKVQIHNFTPRKEMLKFLNQAHICVIPSIWDNSPYTVYEAMFAGRPIIATRVGGIPELVIDGVTAILVEPNNPLLLSQAIINLLKDDSKREEMAKKARKFAIYKFNSDYITEVRLKIYSQALNTKNFRCL